MGGDDHDRGSPTKGDGMMMQPWALNLRLTQRSPIQQHRPAEGADQYADAELYRIVAAQAITDGSVQTKAEFDAIVRTLGTVVGADELIAFRRLRPGCKAWRHGQRMICDCGATWLADDNDPPSCKVMP
jgi:hypothetical protein